MEDEETTQKTPRLPPRALSKAYEAARSQSRLDPSVVAALEDHPTYCAERAKLLLGSYRRNEANDPDAYIQAITLVLSEYTRAVVEYATDPRTGIQIQGRFRNFPPNAGEVKEFCEDEVKRIARMAQPVRKFQRVEYVPRPRTPGCRANFFVKPHMPEYPDVLARTKLPDTDPCDWKMDLDGSTIWCSFAWLPDVRGWSKPDMRGPSDDELRQHYGTRRQEQA